MQYILLTATWAIFGLLHSMFAYSRFKRAVQAVMKHSYKYYRLLYSLFATLNLGVIVWFHFSINSIVLWQNTVVEKTAAILLAIPAFVVMGISIKKYFLNLSGIEVLLNRPAEMACLQQTGLHKFMRHPLYTGTIALVWCIFLWQPTLSNIISATCITLYTRIGIYYEEKKLVREFGDEYIAYSKKTAMLIPGSLKNILG